MTLECGHAMHDLLSRTKYTRFHGWNSSPDFNEIPSMLFENWCWIPSTLRGMNRHYTTLDPSYLRKWQQDHPGQPSPPEQLSDGEIELLMGSRYQHTVQWYLSQLCVTRAQGYAYASADLCWADFTRVLTWHCIAAAVSKSVRSLTLPKFIIICRQRFACNR